jgi:hypothetical protein
MNLKKCYSLVTLLLVAVAIGMVFWGSNKDELDGYQKIQLSMPLEKIEAVIGKPGGYVSEKILAESAALRIGTFSTPLPLGDAFEGDRFQITARVEFWNLESGSITVGFSDDGRAIWKHLVRFPHRSFTFRIKEWLRLD